ncbi:serine/threonine-protein phosphatase 1-like isoform X1 [Gigantopelta aegis]|uniref:serine/threonine-protein phosphatase 1-like isoform X1 n=1 Tax=Gigantopelta aegis TaxID=1735272 RepID=UPI001B88B86E|nr:serine/threonine-protein phosphatase 1-like isoform X1 [Gigantopelta aegis]XP_041348925.1 serine/threonine-protein phosphatase 1-like isoform X1 [Gigantopelta aegis]
MAEKPREARYGLPLPDVCHFELNDELIGNRSVFVVGDVHGCYDELMDLMAEAKKKEPNILYIFAGDFVNKGPKVKEVVTRLQQDDCLAVLGNHEIKCMREARNMAENPNYKLSKRYQWVKGLSSEDLAFIRRLPYTIHIPSLKSIVVHAGLIPGTALEKHCLIAMTHMRNLYLEGEKLIPTGKHDKGKAWATYWTGPEHVYFGHEVQRDKQELEYATGLDTGCCLGLRLTGVFLNGCRETLSVPAHRAYCVDDD